MIKSYLKNQVPQIPKFTYTNNDVATKKNLGYLRQLDCKHLDGYSKQFKIIQTYIDSRIKNNACERGNLDNLDIKVNLNSKTNIQEFIKKSEK